MLVGCSAGERTTATIDAALDAEPEASPPACPEGSSGLLVGQVLPQVALSGYRRGSTTLSDISVCDYWDPDGKKKLRALWLIRSGQWCVPCQNLAAALRTAAPGYLARGVAILEVLVNGSSATKPATRATIDAWIADYSCVYDVAFADVHAFEASDEGFPASFFVDAKTLKIQAKYRGSDVLKADGTVDELEAMLR
jgi:hypothetical protein